MSYIERDRSNAICTCMFVRYPIGIRNLLRSESANTMHLELVTTEGENEVKENLFRWNGDEDGGGGGCGNKPGK